MNKEALLIKVKQAVTEVEPGAEVILYGSRARGDATPESDWDFLVLLDGVVDYVRVDRIRDRLYDVELDAGEIISSIIWNREEWHSQPYRQMPIHDAIEAEGISL